MTTLAEAKKILQRGGVGILPTDTLYGIVGSALSKKTVERIYRLRDRNKRKPMIILIGDLRDLKKLGVHLFSTHYSLLANFWPGKVSIVLPCRKKRFFYLHRGTNTLAFRLPAKKSLRQLLRNVGPLVAPSANLEGKPPAKTIREAKKYFGNRVDMYVDAGRLVSPPSTLIALANKKLIVLRKGAVTIPSK